MFVVASILVVCVFLIYIEPTFLVGTKSHVKILKVGKDVRVVGSNMLCIDYPQVGKLYYFATVKASDVVSVRLVVGGSMYSLLSGKIVVCDVRSNKCRIVNGMMTTLRSGVYNISAATPIAAATFCIQFVG